MSTKFKVDDQIACAICCGGHHTPCPPDLLGTVILVIPAKEDDTLSINRYLIRLPSGMMDWLYDATARVEKPDPSKTAKMRHALGS